MYHVQRLYRDNEWRTVVEGRYRLASVNLVSMRMSFERLRKENPTHQYRLVRERCKWEEVE